MVVAAAAIIWIQWILISIAIAIILWQWFYYRPKALEKRIKDGEELVNFLVQINAKLKSECDSVLARLDIIEGASAPASCQALTSPPSKSETQS